ncbi:FAD-binding oxidoreductase [Sphingomonas ginkgonis]|uniref:FAD-binding oxidoreductase n=1 Tax=Sphingomonas ginkgonis TaxID=2315330 RepID=A0A3R9Y5X0_9SPHN|nr:FAD-binding oxidoreductase [Sphingomonas ginkgonis]RST30785.1 FAD-binding oxidoreductase [Sphingomonas ginkgonis]
MTATADILVVGGGIAGVSAAAELAREAKVILLEGENALGFHSSGRSAAMLHYALGNPLVRKLTQASRDHFASPPDGFEKLAEPRALLIFAREDELDGLATLRADLAPFAEIEDLDEAGLHQLCPALRIGGDDAVAGFADHGALRLDPHALLYGYAGWLRRRSGTIASDARVATIARQGSGWVVTTERGERFTAPLLVNAGGAWADHIAALAGVRSIRLEPRRRTIITFDPPEGLDGRDWPFAKTVGDELYFAPEGGRLFASPIDEVPTDACDSQADEHEVALAAARVEERTLLKVQRVVHRWAGLRSFSPDRMPVVGFDPDDPAFLWLAGQGGFGIQTAPVMARIAAALVSGTGWPVASVTPDELRPGRFR